MKRQYVLTKKHLLPRAACFYQQLIINEENFVLVNATEFLAIENCIPGTQLDILGYFPLNSHHADNESIAFLFNLFPDTQEYFFALQDPSTIVEFPIVLNVVSITELPEIRKLNNRDFVYVFQQKNLFKIKFSNFVKYFDSITECGEVTSNQPTYYKPQGIDASAELTALENILIVKEQLLERLLKQYSDLATKS
jgi:hypothetical protein